MCGITRFSVDSLSHKIWVTPLLGPIQKLAEAFTWDGFSSKYGAFTRKKKVAIFLLHEKKYLPILTIYE